MHIVVRPDLITPFLLYSFVASFTPGPNNLMLLTSGVTFGFRQTWPAMLGVVFGFAFLTLCMGFGLGAIFTRYSVANIVVKYIGAAYMLYLALAIANSNPPDPDAVHCKQPIKFFRSCALQWVNPKGVAMAITAISGYGAVAAYPYNILLLVFLHSAVAIASSISWTGMGTALQRLLHRPKIVRAFNVVMAVLLAASLYPIFADVWQHR